MFEITMEILRELIPSILRVFFVFGTVIVSVVTCIYLEKRKDYGGHIYWLIGAGTIFIIMVVMAIDKGGCP